MPRIKRSLTNVTVLFYFIGKTLLHQIEKQSEKATAITQQIHQTQAPAETAISCIGSRITASHVAVPVSAVAQLLFECPILYISGVHCTRL